MIEENPPEVKHPAAVGAHNYALLPILKWPDERLHEKCVDVTVFDTKLSELAFDMLHTMKAAGGVGLAAPQTGNMINMIAIWLEELSPIVMVNPRIIDSSEDMFEFNEGCLSVPGYFEDRKRPNRIVIQFQDTGGLAREFEIKGLYAFVIQHEIDHLNGKVFVDGASPLKKQRIKARMKKVAKNK